MYFSVPRLVLIERKQVASYLQAHASERISVIQQTFKGVFNGTAILFFPEEKSLELVRLLLQEDVPLDLLTTLEQDAMLEVGNIILNAILATLADMLDMEVRCSLPNLFSGSCYNLLNKLYSTREQINEPVIVLFVDFVTGESAINGYIVLMLDGIALATFRVGVEKLLNQS